MSRRRSFQGIGTNILSARNSAVLKKPVFVFVFSASVRERADKAGQAV
jgi:hypothetical protein